jgi:predicted transcriptional regulator
VQQYISKATTISFVGTLDLKRWLEQQARDDDRSVSWVVRQILDDARKQQQQQTKATN